MICTTATSLDEFLVAVYVPRKLPDAKPNTIRNYRWMFAHFHGFLGREPVLGDLTEEVIGAFVQAMNTGRAPSTVNRCLSCCTALAKLAFRKHLIEEEPVLVPLRELRRQPSAWRPEELQRLFSAVDRFRVLRKIGGVPARAWWRAFLATAYATGGRRAALFGLRLEADVNWVAGVIRFRPETSKVGLEEFHQVPRECIEALRLIRLPARELVFPDDRDPSAFYLDWNRLLRWAGLPGGRRNKTQRLRRSTATHAEIQHAGAGQLILGHASPAMTWARYIDRSQLDGQRVVLSMPGAGAAADDGEMPF